ncbi:NitT/TauT family transport system permease protein [Paenibacillus sophorae]|uniref:ABC transporter permease n=1 Tax=Paenibacillus sophorae TaxID=1333845 RepID=A0A1H8K566_9BACL|nr:ABC transporter permease [Paenibacillus sophorae]QWU13595.1 ABC transporter permease [Paenibacillus sophorae]SEN87558.1 NitT/TauT family transport system permease protein [Paenibacillus sophorae]
MKIKAITRLKSASERWAAIVAVCIAWEAVSRSGMVKDFILPPFTRVVYKLFQLLVTGQMWPDIGASMQRSASGFAISVLVAIPLGFLTAWSPRVRRVLDPVMQFMRNTPTLALYPVFILVFGLGELSKVAIIFWGGVWPVLMNTVEGVNRTDPLLIKSGRSMGASPLTLFFRIILPSALSFIFTGIRLSASRSIIILVAAEMLGADKGLGFLIFSSEQNYKVEQMYAGIIVLILLGVLVNFLLVRWEKRITRWKQEISGS